MKSIVNCMVKFGPYTQVSNLLLNCQKVVTLDFHRNKHTIDYSHVPKLNEDELQEKFVRGSGPGGQAVNKTSNCVVLIHKPTGVVVKCHQSRLQERNRNQARLLLITKLDNLMNGELSIEAQIQKAQLKKETERNRRHRKLQNVKNEWKAREGID